MRARLAVASVVVMALFSTGAFLPAAHAQTLHVAQDDGADEQPEQRPAQPSEPAPSPTEEEAGPPWTYQMARIMLILLALLLLAVGATYYRLVIRRQRGLA